MLFKYPVNIVVEVFEGFLFFTDFPCDTKPDKCIKGPIW